MTQTPTIATTTALRRWRRFVAWALLALGVGLGGAGIGLAAWIAMLGPPPLATALGVSSTVLDRNGKLLRAYATPDGRWRLPVHAATDVDPRYLKLLLGYEDARFYEHHGVDPRALLRAAWQWASEGHIVSGGSTITMQIARLIEPRKERSLKAKLRQMVRAIEIEHRLSKAEILDLYLTLAPYGGNLEGIRAASLAYFGKEPKRLTLAESALLVALPQSPEARRPDRAPKVARVARDRVLDRMVESGRIDKADAERARGESVANIRYPMPMLAPHAADEALQGARDGRAVRLTIDRHLQDVMERLAHDRAEAAGADMSVAIVALDHASGDVVARVGSPAYFDARRAGQVDMTRAVRSPGSTLKPFIYGIAFEDGVAHPNTLIDDRPIRFGNYAPENFDMTFQGTVPVARALQYSLNVPAIALLDRVGPNRLAARLRQAGADLVLPKLEAPGLAMGLGGVGITLTDLVRLYTGLARLGRTVAPREVVGAIDAERDERRLLDPIAAWQVAHVLLGAPPPDNGIPGRIAFKTGTSYGYRDAWAVGFDGRYVIGVWMGRPDGAPVPGMIGRTSAAPILFDAFARTGQTIAPLPKAPRGTLQATNAQLPSTLRRFRPAGLAALSVRNEGPQIVFPPNGVRLDLAGSAGKLEPMALKVNGGALPLRILVNGLPAGTMEGRHPRLIDAPGPGFVRLTVMDARGAADSVVVRLQ